MLYWKVQVGLSAAKLNKTVNVGLGAAKSNLLLPAQGSQRNATEVNDAALGLQSDLSGSNITASCLIYFYTVHDQSDLAAIDSYLILIPFSSELALRKMGNLKKVNIYCIENLQGRTKKRGTFAPP